MTDPTFFRRFEDLGVNEALCRALEHVGYERPTPIQDESIAPLLAGRDLLGVAQTGTGKTAAFALPILQRLGLQQAPMPKNGRRPRARRIRALVLAPTRELAQQIADSFATYGRASGLRHTVVYGGVNKNPQIRALRAGVDILLLDDDVAMPTGLMIGPATWRLHFKDRLARVINIAREESPDLLIFYHCDGNFTRLVPDLVDIGVNIINPIQPDCMDAAAIKREFGDRLAIWGAVGLSLIHI